MREYMMVKLDKTFQKKVFKDVIKQFNGSLKASKSLGIPASSIRGYKNLYFESVPQTLLERLTELNICTQEEIELHTLSKFNKKDFTTAIFNTGRKIRIQELQKFKKNIPLISQVLDENLIDFEKWLMQYFKLVNFGFRQFKYIKIKKSYIEVNYTTYSKKQKKEFVLKFPRKIPLNAEFLYFLGLWCGDRAGGKRLGISNTNNEVITFTEYFLKKNYQKVEKILYIHKSLEEPAITYNKKYITQGTAKGWSISVHSINGVFASFFYYLQENLDYILKNTNPYAFFAGLFDAEGNVSLYNKAFRWACKNTNSLEVYSKHMKKLSLYNGYDGGCIISYNLEIFHKEILPFLKHSDKINLTQLLCTGKGQLPGFFLEVLSYVNKHPFLIANHIAKALKKNKVYAELQLLHNWGYIAYEDYPYKYTITQNGKNMLRRTLTS